MRRQLTIIGIVRLLLFLLVTVPLITSPRVGRSATRATVEGNSNFFLYWNTRSIHFWVNDQGSSDLGLPASVGAARRAFNLWSSPDCTDMSFVYRGTTNLSATNATTENADFTNIVIWRKDGWPPAGAPESNYPKGLISKTTRSYNFDTGEMLDADIELNSFEYTFESSGNGAQWDAETILAHEVGILIGLEPSSDQNTLMASALKTSPGTVRRKLSNDDSTGVCDIYPFESSTPLAPNQIQVLPEVATDSCQFTSSQFESSQFESKSKLAKLDLIRFLLFFCLIVVAKRICRKGIAEQSTQ